MTVRKTGNSVVAGAAHAVVRAFLPGSRRRARGSAMTDPRAAPLLTPDEIADLIAQASVLAASRRGRHDVHQRHPGDARSVHLGRGLDFEESRPYQPGDDIRDMDWRTTARIGKPYLKVYREEHHPMLHVVLDRGPTMRFGTRVQLKATQAARVAILLAVASRTDCACIGGTLVEAQAAPLPCLAGDAGVLALARAAAAPCPPLADAGDEGAPWHALLPRLIEAIPRGSRVVFVTDLLWLGEAHAAALSLLASRQDVAVIEIVDPAEIDLPDVGLAPFRDARSGEQRWIDTHARDVRAAFRREAEALRQARSLWLRRAGVSHLSVRTDAPALDRVAEFLFHE